jgi:hypothetical protein
MSTIAIDWFFLERNGATCSRCSESYEAIRKELARVSRVLQDRGISIDLKEHPLDESRQDRSNSVIINGRDVIELLNERGDIFTFCRSCTDLIGRPTECRAFIYKNSAYESLPAEMLEEAILREARVTVSL